MTKDNEEWRPETVSLCGDCAKHPELKALVESDLTDGVCGVCGSSISKVYNPERFAEVRNLIRALIGSTSARRTIILPGAAHQLIPYSSTSRIRSSRW